jgi:rhodanese-related sulfurtransferase
VGASGGAAGQAAAPARAPVPALDPEEAKRRYQPHGQPYREVSGEDVTFLHARGALFLDARRTNVYREGHVAGARSFPVWESEVVDQRIETLLGEGPDTDAPVVIYCSGGECEDSHMLAQKLFGAGFNNLLVYKDGWPDWQRRGGKAEKGAGS